MTDPFAALLRDDNAVRALLADAGITVDSATVTWRRLTPRMPQRAAVSLMAGGLVHHAALLQFTPERAREVLAKWSRMKPRATELGAGVRALPFAGTLLFLWPNDRNLRETRLLDDKDRLKRALADVPELVPSGFRVRGKSLEISLARYKPELRAVARMSLALKNDSTGERREREVYLRIFPDDRGTALDALQRALRAEDPVLAIPEPLGTLADGRMQIESALPGSPLGTERALQHVDALLESVARLHAARPDVAAAPQDRRRDITDIARLVPALAPLVRDVGRGLKRLVPEGRPGFIHGDLHLYQCLEHSGKVALIDFERAARGFVEDDWGLLLAHVRLAHVEADETGSGALHDILSRRSGCSVLALRCFEARAIASLALGPLRRGAANAEELAEQRLRSAADLLGLFRPLRRRAPELPEVCGARIEKLHPRPGNAWPGVFTIDSAKCHGTLDMDTGAVSVSLPADDPLAQGGTLLAWRPGARAVLRLTSDSGPRILKRFSGSKAKLARLRHERVLQIASETPGFPRIAELHETALGNELSTEFLAGTSLHDFLLEGREEEHLPTVAAALARFHSAPAPDLPPTRPLSTETLLEVFRRFHPELLSRAETLAPLRGPVALEARALVHADLHDRNILLAAGRVALIDLDMVQAGDPDDDMGNLAAHCALRALQRGDSAETGLKIARAVVQLWRAAGGPSREGEALAAARTCFRLAALYSVRRRWRHCAPTLLQLSADPALFLP